MQFRLSTLLLSIVVVATSLALAGAWGIPCAAWSLVLVACLRAAWSGKHGLAGLLAVLLVSPGLCFCMLPLYSHAGPAAFRAQCSNQVKQIALALHNYRDDFGRFPPSFLPDKDGKPAHSWRVLILPYIERPTLYKQYSFSEPWNGPTNAKLAASRPFEYYVCPLDTGGRAPGATSTSYVAVVGPGTIWAESPPDSAGPPLSADAAAKPAEGVSGPKAKPSDPGTRVLVVEVANSGIHWMEPRDLTLEEALAGVNPQSSPAISSHHARGANVVFADGSVRFLPSNTPPNLLKALITEGLDNAKSASITALAASQPTPNDYLGLRLLAWLASIVALLVHGLIVDVRRERAAGKTAPVPARVPAATAPNRE